MWSSVSNRLQATGEQGCALHTSIATKQGRSVQRKLLIHMDVSRKEAKVNCALYYRSLNPYYCKRH